MGQTITLTGMVISASAVGDFDKRIVVLTRERGKVTAFAKGARRQNSSMLAAANPFSFGTFICYEGKSAYNVVQMDISNYFSGLSQDFEAAYYGFYILEIADYYARENNDEAGLLKLLYASLRALLNKNIPNELVRSIYEWKAMVISGEYPQVFCCVKCGCEDGLAAFVIEQDGMVCSACVDESKGAARLLESTIYAYQYIAAAEVEKLYTFTVSAEVLREMKWLQVRLQRKYIDRKFKSLEILETIVT